MNRQQFEYYLNTPGALSSLQLGELYDLTQTFPYCQTLHLMIAKILSQDENVHFSSYLRQAAAHATDRKRLKQLIEAGLDYHQQVPSADIQPSKEPTPPTSSDHEPSGQAPETVPDFERFYQLLTELEQTFRELKSKSTTLSAGYDIEKELEVKEEPSAGTDELRPSTTVDELLERFDNQESRIRQPRASFFDPSDIARRSVVEHEDLVSETLARIYEKQGHIQRAIKIYQQLILKFPEKSSYFAAQIKNLEKDTGKQ